jgi:uncharacterized membrane protein
MLHAANAPYLAVAAGILLFAFVLTRSMHASACGQSFLERINRADRAFCGGAITLTIIYFVIYSYLSVQRYHKFLCGTWDLGIFESLFQNMLSGGGYRDYRGPFDHFQLAGVVFLPFYALWRDGRLLLVLQTAALAAAAWPLYLVAREVGGRAVMGVTVVIAYLLYPFLSSANLYDFHILCLSPFFFFWMLYWMVRRRWGLYALFTLLLLTVKESEAILVLGAGLYLLSRKEWRAGTLTVVGALLWGYLSIFVMLPAITGEPFRHMNRYQGLAGSVSWALSTHAGRWTAVAHALRLNVIVMALLVPMGFLAARRFWIAACVIGPMYAANMLSNVNFQNVLFGHYGITATSAALGAAALATGGMKGFSSGEKPSLWPAFILVVAALANVAFSYPADQRWAFPSAAFRPKTSLNVMSLPIPFTGERADFYRSAPDDSLLLAVRDCFPKDAVICAQNNAGYQIAGRYRLVDLGEGAQADYYILRPAYDDYFTDKKTIALLLVRLQGDGVRCILRIDGSNGGLPEWAFYAKPDKAIEFYGNVAQALSKDPGGEELAHAVKAMNATMGLAATN